MKRLMLATVAAVFLATLGFAFPGQAGPDPKAVICHFPGHDGDYLVGYASEDDGPAPGASLCGQKGQERGNLIEVSVNACQAHGVSKCEMTAHPK